MRQLFLVAAALAGVAFGAGQLQAGKVEIKGVHICCPACAKAIGATLKDVEGVSDAKCDQKTKTVTFTTKDEKTTAAALKALMEAGFYGTATEDGKELKSEAPTPKKGEKADEVTVTKVHVCCGACKKAISALFKDAKVDFPAAGDVKVSGKGLDKAEVLETLRKAGFNGKID
jgi:copper chaperone CopZ